MKSLLLIISLTAGLSLPLIARADQQPVATLNGKPINEAQVESRAATKIYRLRWEIYNTLKTESQALVDELLLEEEASKRNLTPEELLQQEADSKAKKPTEADVDAYMKEQNIEVADEDMMAEMRGRVSLYLTERERIQRRLDFQEQLRQQADYRFLLEPPESPRQQVSTDDDPARGPADAPVTIIHFASFSCEHCAESAGKIRKLTEEFPGAIRWVHRDFFNIFDELGLLSAEAGEMAHANGKFWEFHDQIYTHSGEYSQDDVKRLLAELGMDVAEFDQLHKQASFIMEIKHDIEEGANAGVSSVPAIFVNGRYISGMFDYEKLKQMVAEELAIAPRETQESSASREKAGADI